MTSGIRWRMARWLGIAFVAAILVYLTLPAVVVMLAAFNEKAILSFPPES